MIKRIKLIQNFPDHNGDDRNGEEFLAIVLEDELGNQNASIDVGAGYAYGVSNTKGYYPMFEIVGDVDLDCECDRCDKLEANLKVVEKRLSDTRDANRDKDDKILKLEEKLNSSIAEDKEIKRNFINGGYIIMPTKWLDQELADEIKGSEEIIITPKEIVAMCASAQLEINKGDVRPSSLNVKLYNAINDFAQEELDSMIKAGSSGQA